MEISLHISRPINGFLGTQRQPQGVLCYLLSTLLIQGSCVSNRVNGLGFVESRRTLSIKLTSTSQPQASSILE
jgi:hypothetical protein